jgi:hypothetical protein
MVKFIFFKLIIFCSLLLVYVFVELSDAELPLFSRAGVSIEVTFRKQKCRKFLLNNVVGNILLIPSTWPNGFSAVPARSRFTSALATPENGSQRRTRAPSVRRISFGGSGASMFH